MTTYARLRAEVRRELRTGKWKFDTDETGMNSIHGCADAVATMAVLGNFKEALRLHKKLGRLISHAQTKEGIRKYETAQLMKKAKL